MKDIQQLIKKNSHGGRYEDIFPKTFIDAVEDRESGNTLTEILSGFNMYFLSYNGSRELTRLQVPMSIRKTGLWITYVLYDKTVVTEWYVGEAIDDNSWKSSNNWRVGTNMLVGDISISSDGYWVVNGVVTTTKAQGEQGITPMLRVGSNNHLQASYTNGSSWVDVSTNPVYTQFRINNNKLEQSVNLGQTWTIVSDYIASWFRFTGTAESSQVDNVGKIQISRDNGVTWADLSGEFTNSLHIKGYVATVGALPSTAVQGDIYGVGPTYDPSDTEQTNPIYQLYVKDSTGWINNGRFTSISAGIVQETGNSETEVMSQKAVTDEIAQLSGEKVSSENIVHPVFERVDFSSNSPTLPNGFTIENRSLVFTKAEGMTGNIVAIIPFNIPNQWKAGKYISMRGTSVFGNESSITLVFFGSNGVSMTNQLIGSIPKSGSKTSAIVNIYDSSTTQVKLNVSINSGVLATGQKVYINDVVLTDVAINDFRGLIQVVSNPVIVSEKANHGYGSLEVAKTVKQVDDTVVKLEQNSLKLEPVGDALFNPYDINGVGVNVAYGTPSISYTCPPIPFNDNNALVATYFNGYALYNNEMGILKQANIGSQSAPLRIDKVVGAEFIRLSTPLDKRFDARATYPSGGGHSLKTTDPIKFETDSLVNGADVVFKMNPKDSADYTKKEEFSKISNAFNGITEVIDASPLVNVEDVAISKFGGVQATVAGYVSSGFIDIEEVDKIEFFNTMNNASGGYSPLLFYPASGTTNIRSYTPIFDRAMPFTMYRDSFKDAKRIRVSYLKSQEDKFYIKLTKGSGISYVDLSQRNISAPTLEWAQRNAPSSDVVQVGSFSVRKIATPLAITNASTIVEGYEPINRDLRKPVGKVHVTGSYVNTREMYHVGKYTKKIYCTGHGYGHIGVADSWEDFLDNNVTTISIAPIRAGFVGIREMQNGELIVMGVNSPSGGVINSADGIYVSEGWAENYKTNTPVNFILKQQWQSVRNSPQDAWGFHCVGNKILISEYSTAGSVFENSYVYYSTDFGQTFTAIFDIESQFGNANDRVPSTTYQHIHGCCIDPYWDRLWVFPGEGAVNGQCISYSDDEGATWTHLTTNTLQKTLEGSNTSAWMKYCAAHALDTGVIMGTDSQPNGIWRYNRVKKNVESGSVAPYLEEAKRYDIGMNHRLTITHIMGHLTRVMDSNNEYPVIVCSPMVGLYSNIGGIHQSGLVHISYDGVRFYEIWRESNPDFKAPQQFQDNNMKAYAYKDGTIYIIAKYYDGTSIRNRVVKGVLPEAY